MPCDCVLCQTCDGLGYVEIGIDGPTEQCPDCSNGRLLICAECGAEQHKEEFEQ